MRRLTRAHVICVPAHPPRVHDCMFWRFGAPPNLLLLALWSQVTSLLVADRSMVGLHVRNVFDAPRDSESKATTEVRRRPVHAPPPPLKRSSAAAVLRLTCSSRLTLRRV